jgi:hypothetical protein
LPRAPPGPRQRNNFLFVFGFEFFFFGKGTWPIDWFAILVWFLTNVYYILCILVFVLNFSAYFEFELQVIKTVHVCDGKNDILAF